MLARVKKNDLVTILSGKDKDKRGTVIEILPKKGKVVVKGLGIVTRHVKPRRQGEAGGIKTQEGYISLSKVMPVCPACKEKCRVNVRVLENGDKARVCNRCQETF